MAYVKREIAEKIAACAVEGVTLDQARRIIGEYVSSVSVCAMCGGTGRFTFGRTMDLVLSRRNQSAPESQSIERGSTGQCPGCGGLDVDGLGGGDPEYVAWHCTEGDDDYSCRNSKKADNFARSTHAKCGYRVMLPYDRASTSLDDGASGL